MDEPHLRYQPVPTDGNANVLLQHLPVPTPGPATLSWWRPRDAGKLMSGRAWSPPRSAAHATSNASQTPPAHAARTWGYHRPSTRCLILRPAPRRAPQVNVSFCNNPWTLRGRYRRCRGVMRVHLDDRAREHVYRRLLWIRHGPQSSRPECGIRKTTTDDRLNEFDPPSTFSLRQTGQPRKALVSLVASTAYHKTVGGPSEEHGGWQTTTKKIHSQCHDPAKRRPDRLHPHRVRRARDGIPRQWSRGHAFVDRVTGGASGARRSLSPTL